MLHRQPTFNMDISIAVAAKEETGLTSSASSLEACRVTKTGKLISSECIELDSGEKIRYQLRNNMVVWYHTDIARRVSLDGLLCGNELANADLIWYRTDPSIGMCSIVFAAEIDGQYLQRPMMQPEMRSYMVNWLSSALAVVVISCSTQNTTFTLFGRTFALPSHIQRVQERFAEVRSTLLKQLRGLCRDVAFVWHGIEPLKRQQQEQAYLSEIATRAVPARGVLTRCIWENDVEGGRDLLCSRPGAVHKVTEIGMPVVHLAVLLGNFDFVKLLVELMGSEAGNFPGACQRHAELRRAPRLGGLRRWRLRHLPDGLRCSACHAPSRALSPDTEKKYPVLLAPSKLPAPS